MRRTLLAFALLASATPAIAQVTIRPRAGALTMAGADDPQRAMLGLSTSPSGRRDTLGLLVTSVTAGSPAEKAGIEEGNRLISINGVNLKLSRDDADDDFMQGVNQNRLQREMRKLKAGDEASLEVWGGGRSRAVRVKTVAAEELNPVRTAIRERDTDRAALGLFLSTTGNKRDTAGVFVQQVVEGGPAEKAGIVEGDRIASINGVDVRVSREDAGDWNVASSRIDRLEREIRKLTPGSAVDLVVVSGGRSRTVKVSAVRANELPGGEGFSYRFGGPDGAFRMFAPGGDARAMIIGPNGTRSLPRIQLNRDGPQPRIRINRDGEPFEFDGDFKSIFPRDFDSDMDAEVRAKIEDAMSRLKERGVLPLKVGVRAMSGVRM